MYQTFVFGKMVTQGFFLKKRKEKKKRKRIKCYLFILRFYHYISIHFSTSLYDASFSSLGR